MSKGRLSHKFMPMPAIHEHIHPNKIKRVTDSQSENKKL